MNQLNKILGDFELHSASGIRDCFAQGVDPNAIHKGKPLVYELINMYTRGPAFRECMQVFVEHGLNFEDPVLLSVLLNDADSLERQLLADRSLVTKRVSLDCAFTSLFEASLLHVCAEYNHVSCAEVLVRHGADVNAPAGLDENGFGAHTPVFHTVNQHANRSMDMLQFLLGHGVDLSLTVKGLIWGRGYAWETFIPSVNPVSYAMMGLLRQFQRTEQDIYAVVSLLMKAAYGSEYQPGNIPNKYLEH